VPDRAYLSIGEVLALLKDEFADITISKIRFLESQGLIDPERTPSGYRKFYEPDVERLRWILRQQKEHYLPLRVIKGKLSEAPLPEDDEVEPPAAVAVTQVAEVVPPPPALAAVPDPPEELPEANGSRPGRAVASSGAPEPVRTGRRSAPPFPESLRRSSRTSSAAFLTAPDPPRPLRPPAQPAPPPPTPPPSQAPSGRSEREAPGPGPDLFDEEIELTVDELATASGLPPLAVAELERYGLVKGKPGPGGRYYDASALDVANLAAAFARFGVEARHLKMWKTAADREADFYEQVVTPIRSQRSNKARRQAGDTVAELSDLGARLHAALVADAMKRLR
jgi:DNA-binding transcriptional MerR regulator